MVATFLECIVVTHWLPLTPIQFYFFLILEFKKVWSYLSSLSIQTRVFIEALRIILLPIQKYIVKFSSQYEY